MSTAEAVLDQPQSTGPVEKRQVINDFSIQVATANGSGSQTSNMVLLRSIFQMGVPISGKNLFPSNIAGLPTWYTIRAKGIVASPETADTFTHEPTPVFEIRATPLCRPARGALLAMKPK